MPFEFVPTFQTVNLWICASCKQEGEIFILEVDRNSF